MVKKELELMKDTTGFHHHINVGYGLRTKTVVIY